MIFVILSMWEFAQHTMMHPILMGFATGAEIVFETGLVTRLLSTRD